VLQYAFDEQEWLPDDGHPLTIEQIGTDDHVRDAGLVFERQKDKPFCGAWALARDHQQVCGESLDAAEINRRAAAGNNCARQTLERYTDRMARALASVINIIDPEVIVLGGGVSNMVSLYEDVPQRWSRYVFSDRVDTKLVRAMHGDSSGVRGAASLWPARETA